MLDIEMLENNNKKYTSRYNQFLGKKKGLEEEYERTKNRLEELRNKSDEIVQMKEVLEIASQEARKNSVELLQEVCTNALKMSMGDNKGVVLEITKKNGIPSAHLYVKITHENGVEVITSPDDEDAGGVADIVALSTLMSVRMLAGKNNTAPYFLDEPTKCVSKEKSENTAKFIKELVDYTGIQTIMVTQEREFLPNYADKSYLIDIDENGVSTTTAIKE